LPAARTVPAVSARTATAIVVNAPVLTATEARVEELHVIRQHVFHRFILSLHAFLLIILKHKTIAILLVAL